MKAALLVAGLMIGGILGFFTRPDAAEIRAGGVSIEIQTGGTAPASARGGITTGQWQHIGMFAVGGAVLGLLAGFALDRRR
ncbi:hypothetical protein [Enterovirga rhinocerotis]|uniref:Uncharacterized protein n=1 Tax=Enterovirga rhinocerotis TaxID=1339210 RepID=A0A4R7C8V7_9HYPH|nr:hypothetical protein [Enterovirga rhinocerotis]TDR93137.1 hypothetical protein EV668_0391 [Enterovirga rhinocerotis]